MKMTVARFNAHLTVARRLSRNPEGVDTARTAATEQLISMGLNPGMAVEIATDAARRLHGDSPRARYERLLAQHDWAYEFSDDGAVWRRGRDERAQLSMMAAQLDPDRKLWDEYARSE